MSIEAMRQALEALDGLSEPYDVLKAQNALRAAIEQSEKQEPVAWMNPSWIDPDTRGWESDSFNAIPIEGWVPLYTAPRQWQGLTDKEIENMMDYWSEPARSAYGGAHTANGEYVCIADIIRDAEKRLKEKNT